jgi:hypothetical protein
VTAGEDAARFDAEDRPIEAIAAYERAIAEGGVPLETYINLALIYLSCYDPGFAAFHHIAPETIEASSHRFDEVLAKAEQQFGRSPEIEFWRRYLKFFGLGEPPFYDEARALANEGAAVAYLHLAGEGPYQKHTQALLDSVEGARTRKERFIKSVLESFALREWWAAGA